MNSLGAYIVSVAAAAVIAAIVKEIAGNGSMGKLTGYLSGLFVAAALMVPLTRLELPDAERWLSDFEAVGETAAAFGESMAREEKMMRIKSEVEAYILDKAAACGAVLEVEAELNDAGIPAAVYLRGRISQAARLELSQMIRADLGVEEAAQFWIQ